MLPFLESRDGTAHAYAVTQMDFPLHMHGEIELMYMTEGSMWLRTDAGDELLQKGDLGVCFPNAIHGYGVEAEEAHGIMVIFPASVAPSLQRIFQTKRPVSPRLAAKDVHEDIRYVMARILREQESKSVLSAYLALVLARVGTMMPLRDADSPVDQALLGRLIGYLSQRYQEPLTLEGVAAALGASPFHLSRLINEQLHYGFRAYVNTLRVSYAQQLLRQGDMSVTQIGYECGFESLRTFNRAFASICKETPREYRAAQS